MIEKLRFDKETELYPVVKTYLEAEGYRVKAEVKDCDVMAEREGHFLIVELKLKFNLKLVFQVVERLKKCPNVMIAIPDYAFDNRSNRKADIMSLMKKIGAGILVVSKRPSGIHIHPELDISKMGKRINRHFKKEFEDRTVDLNFGGSHKQKLVTAYRERAIQVAALLSLKGDMKASDIRDITGNIGVRDMLYQNHVGWFIGRGKGIYALSVDAREIAETYPELYKFYFEFFKERYE